jgi:hypothetical protein
MATETDEEARLANHWTRGCKLANGIVFVWCLGLLAWALTHPGFVPSDIRFEVFLIVC